MGIISLLAILIVFGLAVLVAILFLPSLIRSRGTRSLVLRRLNISKEPTADVIVDIVAQTPSRGGERCLRVTRSDIRFTSSTPSTKTCRIVPFSNLSSIHCAYSRPIVLLALGLLFVLAGFVLFFIIRLYGLLPALIIGGILLIRYWLSKSISISVETIGGMVLSIAFKRSLIHNVTFDINKAIEVIDIINKLSIESPAEQIQSEVV